MQWNFSSIEMFFRDVSKCFKAFQDRETIILQNIMCFAEFLDDIERLETTRCPLSRMQLLAVSGYEVMASRLDVSSSMYIAA